MAKFNSQWTDEKIKDLLLAHKGKSHAETAMILTQKWGESLSRDSVKNKYNSLKGYVDSTGKEKEVVSVPKNREFFNRTQSDEGKKGKRTYVVTSVIAGCAIDKPFFASLETFLADKKAKLVVLPMRGVISKGEEYTEDVLEVLSDSFYTKYVFNSNLEALDLFASPTQADPLTGLYKYAQKKSNIILASPKQEMKSVPVSNVKMPHILRSTGTICEPEYNDNRIGFLSAEDHQIGALIVEVLDNEFFYVREIQASEDGSFIDLDKKYNAKLIEGSTADAMVFGDLHVGQIDQPALDVWTEVLNVVKPKSVFLHDVFDSLSISHHLENNLTQRSGLPEFAKTLEIELDNLCRFLSDYVIPKKDISFYAVASNHDSHVMKYINEGRFFKDYTNYRIALKLALYMCDGKNPVAAYVEEKLGKIKNLTWLEVDQDLKIHDIQLASHGHIGIHGSFGSIASAEKSYYKAIIGHSHVSGIQGGIWSVGTTTKLKLSYNTGPSAWSHSSALIHPNGNRQLIFSINGKWKI